MQRAPPRRAGRGPSAGCRPSGGCRQAAWHRESLSVGRVGGGAGCSWAPGHPRRQSPPPLTVGAAPGPRPPGRCPLKVGLDPRPAQHAVPVQGIQDVADRVHQVSHVALALGEKLQSTGLVSGGRGSGGGTARHLPARWAPGAVRGSPCPALAPVRGGPSPQAQRTGARVGGDRAASAQVRGLKEADGGSTQHQAKLASKSDAPVFQLYSWGA